MTANTALKDLMKTNNWTIHLQKGAPKSSHVKNLQQLLFELGFAPELNWYKFGADGDYGSSTTAAVEAFCSRNNLPVSGSSLSNDTLAAMLARYATLIPLRQLYRQRKLGKLNDSYNLESPDSQGVLELNTLLTALHFTAPTLVENLTQFAQQKSIPFDTKTLSDPLADAIVESLSPFYGKEWNIFSANEGLEIGTVGKLVHVKSENHSAKFHLFRRGIYTLGEQSIPAFFKQEDAAALIAGLQITPSAQNVIQSISENEGNLDAINTWDACFLSFGIFQWTLGMNTDQGELPALLRKLKQFYPEVFTHYFGFYQLDISPDTNSTYGYLTYRGQKVNQIAAKDKFRQPEWAFRFWQAGQDPFVKTVQVEHAISRLKNFYFQQKIKGHLLSDLITSEYGVALILDHHVNRPGYVMPSVESAMAATGLTNPANWTTAEEEKLLNSYLTIRQNYPTPDKAMTDAKKRGEVTKKYLRQGVISAERGSFKSTTGNTRSLGTPAVPTFDPNDYPEIQPEDKNGILPPEHL